MKKICTLFFSTFILSASAQIEFGIPETPKKIEFANVIVNLDNDTQNEVNKYVIALLTPQNTYLDAKLELMQWYFPFIEEILEKENVPDDLKYLAVQESGLKPDALSSSAAVGFWQFKEATGKELGLRIDNDIDERRYILASTKAAATYFKKNNIIYKNWISCIYAYNQGPTGAAKDIPDNWSYASEISFTKDTPDYLLKALAHRIAYEHRLNRMKSSSKTLVPYNVTEKSLAEVAVELTVDLSELRKYNAWLFSAATPRNKEYTLMIPISTERESEISSKINERRELAKTDKGYPKLVRKTMVTTSEDEPVFYEINSKKGILAQAGTEASQLSKKADITLTYFLKFNDLTDKDIIKSGIVYYLEPKGKKGPVQFHTAGKNQTFWDVSHMYGVRYKKILKYNRLKSPEPLQPGRVVWLQKKRPSKIPVEIIREVIIQEVEEEGPVKIPVASSYENEPVKKTENKPVIIEENKPIVITKTEPKKKEAPVEVKKTPLIDREPSYSQTKTHSVNRGETFYSISRKYNLSLSELLALNNMTTSHVLQYGEVLKVGKTAISENTLVNRPTTPVNNRPVATRNPNNVHIVEKGQTLYSISKIYNASVSNLQIWNHLSDYSISIGQSLIISEEEAPQRSVAKSSSHVVEKGQTLYSISKMYKISVSQLRTWNGLNDNTISIGQELIIKK
jgi:membrane-bound lytic murein transglycosylase D